MFLEHCSWLTKCALGITHGQRDHAEDLVHATFLSSSWPKIRALHP